MPTRVLLLRHAETADPTVFHGSESDVGLSERGFRQAAAVAPLLAAEKPDAIVSSGMKRAILTATPIALACGLELRTEPLLHERSVGELSGKPHASNGDVWTETLRRWIAGETGYAHAGAESYDALRLRLLPVWRRLTEEHDNKTLVVVAHGHVCKILFINLLEGLGLTDWSRLGSIRNVAISELVREGDSWRAVRLNQLLEGVPAS